MPNAVPRNVLRRRTAIFATFALSLLGSGVASAQDSAMRPKAPDSQERRLAHELREIIRDPSLSDAFSGVHVRSVSTGRTLFDHNGAKLFNPASNMKLLTTATALWHLGPSYRFRTDVRRDARLEGGVVNGNVYIKGYGDPTLTTEEVFGLVNEVALDGITKITGDLIVDDTFFDDRLEGPGWDQETGDHAYAAPVGALSFNFNTFEVRVTPGDHSGAAAKARVWPDVPGIEVVSNAVTLGYGTRSRIWIGTSTLDDGRIRVTVRGTIAADDAEGTLARRRVNHPSRHAGEMFVRMLELRGVEVRGKVKLGRMPVRGTVQVATRFSKPLADIVSALNKYSNNFIAEQILKTLGAELIGVPGSWDKGNQAVSDFLNEIGVPAGTFVLANGSGLNDVNRVTPQQITRVLQVMYERFEVRPEFVASLAVAGTSGTITGRFGDSPAVSRLRAKTGSLTGVSALSGYVVTQTDEVLVFSVMMNDYPGRARPMWRIQDRIGIALANFRNSEAVAHSKGDGSDPQVAQP